MPCAGIAARLLLPKGEVLSLLKGEDRVRLLSMPAKQNNTAAPGMCKPGRAAWGLR